MGVLLYLDCFNDIILLVQKYEIGDNMDKIYSRVSSRKFSDEQFDRSLVEKVIDAALHAPSATFCQNSYFVVVDERKSLNELAEIVTKKGQEIANSIDDETTRNKFLRATKYHTFFKDASVFILVYMQEYGDRFIEEIGSKENTRYIKDNFDFYNPGLQSVSAAMQNLCLQATDLGLGTCWMSGFLYAVDEINEYLGMDGDRYKLVCGTPLGISLDFNRAGLKRKSVEEHTKFYND